MWSSTSQNLRLLSAILAKVTHPSNGIPIAFVNVTQIFVKLTFVAMIKNRQQLFVKSTNQFLQCSHIVILLRVLAGKIHFKHLQLLATTLLTL